MTLLRKCVENLFPLRRGRSKLVRNRMPSSPREGRTNRSRGLTFLQRFPADEQQQSRDFARFPVDVGIDEVLEPLTVVTGEDWLGFGGVKPPSSRNKRNPSANEEVCSIRAMSVRRNSSNGRRR
jgi:hypothetical protein